MTSGAFSYVLLGGVGLLTVAVALSVSWSLIMLRQPRALVERGEWREAASAAERMGRSWLRIFPSVREEAAHARAACLHLEGKLDESLVAARALREGALLEGANLVLSAGDPKRAVRCLRVACAGPRSSPEDLLFLALAELAAGDARRGDVLFAKAGAKRPTGAPSPRIYEPAFHYLRGLYLVKTGRAEEAADDLEEAASSAVTTIYVERARALVMPAPTHDGDPRSSLTGQVIDE